MKMLQAEPAKIKSCDMNSCKLNWCIHPALATKKRFKGVIWSLLDRDNWYHNTKFVKVKVIVKKNSSERFKV